MYSNCYIYNRGEKSTQRKTCKFEPIEWEFEYIRRRRSDKQATFIKSNSKSALLLFIIKLVYKIENQNWQMVLYDFFIILRC